MKIQNGVHEVKLSEFSSVQWNPSGSSARWEVILEDAEGSVTLHYFFSSADMEAYMMLESIYNDGHGFRPEAPANWDHTKFLVNNWAQQWGVDPLGNEELQQHLWNPLKHMLDTYNPLTPPLGESEEGDPAMEAMHQLLVVTKDAADRAEIEAEMEKRRQYLAENPPTPPAPKRSKQDIAKLANGVWSPELEEEWKNAPDARTRPNWDKQTDICGHPQWCGRDAHRPDFAVDGNNSTIFFDAWGVTSG